MALHRPLCRSAGRPRRLPLAAAAMLTLTAACGQTPVAELPPLSYALRVSGEADEEATLPMVVVLHDVDAEAESLLERVLRGENRPARFIAPRAPTGLLGTPRWFVPARPWRPEAWAADGVERAAAQVASLTRRWMKRHPTDGRPMVIGFGQGATVALWLAVGHGNLFRQVVAIAGSLPAPLLEREIPTSPSPLVALHGRADGQVPYEPARKVIRVLAKKDVPIFFRSYPDVGHEISPTMLQDLRRRLSLTP